MRVRKITPYKRATGRFASNKMGRMMYWESTLERDYFYLLEFDPDVLSYREQSFKIHYTYEGEKRVYTPDILVVRKNKTQVVEVKPSSKINNKRNLLKFNVGRRYCKKNGYEFIVVTEKEIREGELLSNLHFLYRFVNQRPSELESYKIKKVFKKNKCIKIKNISKYFTENKLEYLLPKIYYMIYFGELFVDLIQEITNETEIKLG